MLLYGPALLFAACLCTRCQSPQAEKSTAVPNLVLILADDLGYADVGFNGCKDIPTPHIDRIANEGVVFTNAYVTWAACGPSRAGLITGRQQERFGFRRNPLFAPNDPDMGLPLSEQTLAEALGQVGYRSAAIGKWHLGAHPSLRPLQRGFDDFYGFLTGGHRYFPEEWTLEDEYQVKSQFAAYRTKLLRNNQRVEEEEYLTDALSREAVHYIREYKDDPFFLYLAYNAPHGPLQATESYLDRFEHIEERKRKTYAAMVSAVDDGVGRILDQLDQLGLSDNTLVVFLSDNGGPEHVNASDNGSLRGRKGQLYEGGVRVPFAMRWPSEFESGQRYDSLVSSLDIFATMAARSEERITLRNPLDGVDLLPFLNGEKEGSPHQALFWSIHDREEVAVRSHQQKLIVGSPEAQLYDLRTDIGESENLAEKQPAVVDRLQKQQKDWLSTLAAPTFMGLAQDSLYNVLHPDRFVRPGENQ
ncbi:MAG: sulfatase-like hydrolase/transferase [Saprospiraceae bacterium]|nr:sulfatase-like hydrolase/transferase [Saprospiraceae bacterium]